MCPFPLICSLLSLAASLSTYESSSDSEEDDAVPISGIKPHSKPSEHLKQAISKAFAPGGDPDTGDVSPKVSSKHKSKWDVTAESKGFSSSSSSQKSSKWDVKEERSSSSSKRSSHSSSSSRSRHKSSSSDHSKSSSSKSSSSRGEHHHHHRSSSSGASKSPSSSSSSKSTMPEAVSLSQRWGSAPTTPKEDKAQKKSPKR